MTTAVKYPRCTATTPARATTPKKHDLEEKTWCGKQLVHPTQRIGTAIDLDPQICRSHRGVSLLCSSFLPFRIFAPNSPNQNEATIDRHPEGANPGHTPQRPPFNRTDGHITRRGRRRDQRSGGGGFEPPLVFDVLLSSLPSVSAYDQGPVSGSACRRSCAGSR